MVFIIGRAIAKDDILGACDNGSCTNGATTLFRANCSDFSDTRLLDIVSCRFVVMHTYVQGGPKNRCLVSQLLL